MRNINQRNKSIKKVKIYQFIQNYIKIIKAQVIEESLINYIQYQIKGIYNEEQFFINIRLNDFVIQKEEFYRNILSLFYPQKNLLYNIIVDIFQSHLDLNVIIYHSNYLTYFLKKIMKISYLWLGEEISIFIIDFIEQFQELAQKQYTINIHFQQQLISL
ncbi:unnamed protein product [Paramecium sonneborni]|uniref:Uncharacterized protein n=1 Tax=Paramecium sonneborni TaxID=65129 RepID=A0A8S1QMF1_9CILI|nr:unnamed protein product [Paramecium sonneborni]